MSGTVNKDDSCNAIKDDSCNVVGDCPKHPIADFCPMTQFWTGTEPPSGYQPPVADSDDTVDIIGENVIFQWGAWCWKFTGNTSSRPVNFAADDANAVLTFDTCSACTGNDGGLTCPEKIKVTGLASLVGSCMPFAFQVASDADGYYWYDSASISVPNVVVLPSRGDGCGFGCAIGTAIFHADHKFSAWDPDCIFTDPLVLSISIMSNGAGSTLRVGVTAGRGGGVLFAASAAWLGTSITLSPDSYTACGPNPSPELPGLGSGTTLTIEPTTDDLTTGLPVITKTQSCPDPNAPPDPGPPAPPPPPPPPPTTYKCMQLYELHRLWNYDGGGSVGYAVQTNTAVQCVEDTGQTDTDWGSVSYDCSGTNHYNGIVATCVRYGPACTDADDCASWTPTAPTPGGPCAL